MTGCSPVVRSARTSPYEVPYLNNSANRSRSCRSSKALNLLQRVSISAQLQRSFAAGTWFRQIHHSSSQLQVISTMGPITLHLGHRFADGVARE